MGSVLRYLLAGLALSAVWLLIALAAIPGGLREIEEFSLFGWPALGVLFLVPIALIWLGLWAVRLQRRVARLQQLIFDYGAGGPLQAPSYPLQRARERAGVEPPLAEAWQEDPQPEPEPPHAPDQQEARAPTRVRFSALDPLPADPETAHAERRAAPQPEPAGRGARYERAGPAARPRRAPLPEPESGPPDTRAEPLPDGMEPHRPPRAAPDAPRLEALTPTYRSASEVPAKPLSPEQFRQYEARTERELNAVAMDLASIVSAPDAYDRALAALNGGADHAFFELLARDFQSAGQAAIARQLAMVGGDGMLDTYLEKYEQLLVVAYRSEPGGSSVKRLVDSWMGRLHQAIETHRHGAARR